MVACLNFANHCILPSVGNNPSKNRKLFASLIG
jgi:hypothetical protein